MITRASSTVSGRVDEPERDLSGPALEAGTGLAGARLRGVHLRLPGHGPEGPTLEIFAYDALEDRTPTAVNRAGFGHVAFEVDRVEDLRGRVLSAGGKPLGSVVTTPVGATKRVTWCYVEDPEGNVVELQRWSSALEAAGESL